MELLKGMNENQLEAVKSTQTHLRIVAGAGSGKTRVVTTRIAYLIEEFHIAPFRILAITFTNKAANEMKERVDKLLGTNNSGVFVSTIHSLCVRILREEIRHFDYPRNFVILDSDDQKTILREIYKKLDIDVKAFTHNQALSYISNNKTALFSAEQVLAHAMYDAEKMKAQVYELYENKLKELMALDFDDLLLFVYKLFQENSEVREKWQQRFDYIHVDEFQDVDEIQYGIVKNLVSSTAFLCVVGDPDQTIYTWRGAKVDIIMNFEKDFKSCKSIILNENYRSTKSILAGANALIKHNEYRVDKDLFTSNNDDYKIHYYESSDERFEALWIAKKILALKEQGVPYHQIAILYRSNYLSRNLEKVLLDGHIPYRIYGGVKFFERAEIKDALSYLRLMNDAHRGMSELAIKRIINVPKRGAGIKTLENIANIAEANDMDYFDVLAQFAVAKGKTQVAINEFVALIQTYRSEKDDYSISIVLRKLLEESGYLVSLEQANELERLENINELLHDIDNYEENNPDGNLDEYLQMISLYVDTQNEEFNESIQLMSVHAAKGLEFDCVFVYSLCEGIFPSERSVNEGGKHALEEERRLAYVAFTRARKKLFLTSSNGYSYVTQRMKSGSRFISELGDDVLDKEGEVFNQYAARPEAKKTVEQSRGSAKMILGKNKQKDTLKKGDLIQHISFGDGVVISLKDGVATIAFDKRFGIKRLGATHPSIQKK